MSFLQQLFGPPSIDKLKAKGDVMSLIERLETKKYSEYEATARALGELGDSRAVTPLVERMKRYSRTYDTTGYLAVYSTKALGMIGDETAIGPLVDQLGSIYGPLREAAVEALGEIGGTRVVEPLLAALQDGNMTVAIPAARALGKVGSQVSNEPLHDRIKDCLRRIVVGEDTTDALYKALGASNTRLRETAEEVLETLEG